MNQGIDFVYSPALLDSESTGYYWNVLLTPEGHVTAMPFDTGREGLWQFDGQIFSMVKDGDAIPSDDSN